MATDLGAVIQNSQSQVDVEILTEPSDVNQMYDETLSSLRNRMPQQAKAPPLPSETEKEQQAKDYYANVRTNVGLPHQIQSVLLFTMFLNSGTPYMGSLECW